MIRHVLEDIGTSPLRNGENEVEETDCISSAMTRQKIIKALPSTMVTGIGRGQGARKSSKIEVIRIN